MEHNNATLLTKLSRFFQRHASGRNVFIFLGAQLLFSMFILPSMMTPAPNGSMLPVLDLMFGFTSEQAYEILTAYGPEGRKTMLKIAEFVDVIYPVCYTLFNIFAISWFLKRIIPINSPWQKINLIALLPLLFDLLENVGLIFMVDSYPVQNDGATLFASVCNQLKWYFAIVTYLLILTGLGTTIIKSLSKKVIISKP